MRTNFTLICEVCKNPQPVVVSIGHGKYQEFAYPCSVCRTEQRFGMDIDQDTPNFSVSNLRNVTLKNALPDASNRIEFDTETLIPRNSNTLFSPFILTSHLPDDPTLFHQYREDTFRMCRSIWPVIDKCKTFNDCKSWKFYEKEIKIIDPDFKMGTDAENSFHYWEHLRMFGSIFGAHKKQDLKSIADRVFLAQNDYPNLCAVLFDYLNKIGWTEALPIQLFSLRKRWAEEIYPIVQPLFITYYCAPSKINLSDYKIAQKRFEDLKSFYIDLFELTSRVSLIALAFESISDDKSLEIQTKKGGKDLEWYRGLDNGNKWDHLKARQIGKMFSIVEHSKIRNGVGHYSAFHDVFTDLVNFRNEGRKSIIESNIPYIEFCKLVSDGYVNFEIVSIYIHWLIYRGL